MVIKETKQNDKDDVLEIKYEIYQNSSDSELENYAQDTVIMERFNDKLRYNEPIPLSSEFHKKEAWKVGDIMLII